jgi:hypothetical protein
MPTRMRESPFSFAAAEKLEKGRSFGDGSVQVLPRQRQAAHRELPAAVLCMQVWQA